MKLLWQNSVDQRSIWRETAVDTSDTECKCNVKSMIWKENTVNNKALVWRFTNDFSTRLQNSETRSPGVFAVNVNLARGFFVWLCFYQPQRSRWWPSPHSSHSLCLLQTGSLSLGSFIFRPPSIPPVVSSLFFKCETLENWNSVKRCMGYTSSLTLCLYNVMTQHMNMICVFWHFRIQFTSAVKLLIWWTVCDVWNNFVTVVHTTPAPTPLQEGVD